VKLNLTVGIFISDNTDLGLTVDLAQWIWHRLGSHNRNILPACVVQKIRVTFPSEEYCGFKYATVEYDSKHFISSYIHNYLYIKNIIVNLSCK
jgi:hypothetical protein